VRRLPRFLALGLLSCAAPIESGDGATHSTTTAIIKGVASSAAEDSVVAIGIRSQGYLVGLCTGTVVAPNLVLTARHCVADTDDNALCTADGKALGGGVVRADRSPGDLDVYRGVDAIGELYKDGARSKAAAHGKTLVVEGSTLCNADLAFLVLDRALPAPYAPIRTTATLSGASLTAVGYGLTETGDTAAARQTRGGVLVRAVGKVSYAGGVGLGDAEFLVGESACSGDSGGPLLTPTGVLVGVTSRGGGGTGPNGNSAASCMGEYAHTIYTHLATKQDLVSRAYAAAGVGIWREGESAPWDPNSTSSAAPSGEANAASAAVDGADASDGSPAAPVKVDGNIALPAGESSATTYDTAQAPVIACATSHGRARPAEGWLALCFGVIAFARARRRSPARR